MGRSLTQRDLAYDRISSTWESFVSNYDTERRLEVLVDEFLGRDRISGKRCLDAGCGLGFFSHRIMTHGPGELVSVDIAPAIVKRLKERLPSADCREADLLDLDGALSDQRFDTVVCSEVIEHTPDPKKAVEQLARRVAAGGWLAISCPNRRWKWLLYLAQLLGVRKKEYDGHENWVAPADLKNWIGEAGLEIIRSEGVHTVPWQFLPKSVLKWLDRAWRRGNYPFALNLAILAHRPSVATAGPSVENPSPSAERALS